ncbi:MAG: EAL domain-containing protein [Pseudomonadota bacterium]|nr:EAL domain-containing protein [Pseudomonadota bacterium]
MDPLVLHARRAARALRDLPIGIKAFAASGTLLLCLGALSAHALFAMGNLSAGLRHLSSRELPKQQVALAVKSDAIATHVNIYRFVAWSSSGVNAANLDALMHDIRRDARNARTTLAALAARSDLSKDEQGALSNALAKWDRYTTALDDTMDIAATDPALGTMMLGGTDEDYRRVAKVLDDLASRVTSDTTAATLDLVRDADRSKWLIAGGGLLAMLLGVGATVIVIRSVVKPIEAVSRTLRADAAGHHAIAVELSERRDEIGEMMKAIMEFREQIECDNRLLSAGKQALAVQNARFNAALNNMSQGLAMFDAERRLIVCNTRYAKIYSVPPELTRPGTTQLALLQHRVSSGVYADNGAASYVRSRLEVAAANMDDESTIELSDGRMVAVVHRAMPDGGWVSTHEDATERCKAEQKIAHMARHDALTGLPNRLLFREEMEGALANAARGETVAVLCIDLDRFKEVNDTLGHPAGDQLLVMAAERLRGCVRQGDTIARLGGDEFAVIARALGCVDDVAVAARRIVTALNRPFRVDGHEAMIGASIGIAVATEQGMAPHTLLRNADVALYRAKNEGRRTFRFFEAEMDTRLKARHKLEVELRHAVAENQFELAYQPIVSLDTGRVTGFEALIRWRHPERGVIAPGEFIDVAEETELIAPINDWVLRTACADAATWPKGLGLGVNLSPSQLRSQALMRSLTGALNQSKLDPQRLEIEITESVLLQDNEATLNTLHDVQRLGVRIALDDFGTGYSSLSYLLRFPFDKIKIDRTFVKDVGTRPEADAIVRAVVSLARSLEIATTAEGVETEMQLAWLHAEGCTEAQGFLYSTPRPAVELAQLLCTLERRNRKKPLPRAVAMTA